MFSSNNKISLRQIQTLIFINGFASVFLVLSRFLSDTAGNFGIFLILLLGICISFFVSFCLSIFEKYNKLNFKNIIFDVFGKYVGNSICFFIGIKLLLSSAFMLRIFCEFIRETTLFKTHISITSAIIVLLCIYSYKGNMESFGRLSEIIFITVFLPLLIVFMSAIINTDYTNILPLFDTDKKGIFGGLATSSCIFFGIENIFITYSYINKNNVKNSYKSIFTALLFLTICATISYFFTITRYGVYTTSSKLFPMISMLDTVEIPGAFIEKQLVFVIWTVMAFTFIFINSGFISTYSMFNIKSNIVKIILGFIIIVICIIPSNVVETIKLFFIVNLIGSTIFGIALPFVLVLYCIFKGRVNCENIS